MREYCPVCGQKRRDHERGWWEVNGEQFFHPGCRVQFEFEHGARAFHQWLIEVGILSYKDESDVNLIKAFLEQTKPGGAADAEIL